VPYDIKAAANAAKLGQTFADANRTAKAGVAIRDIAKTIMGVGEGEVIDEQAKPKSSLLGKIDLKGMLSKKAKPAEKAKEKA
jgi:pilus assembly protein CpaE